MIRVPAVLLAVLASSAGCQGTEHCAGNLPLPTHGTLVRLSAATGLITSVTTVPYARGVEATSGVLRVVPFDGSPTPVARVDVRSTPVGQVRSENTTLLGTGSPPWRLAGAGGELLATVGDRVVVRGVDDQLRGVRLTDGQPVWNARLDHHVFAHVATVAGNVAVAVGMERVDPSETRPPEPHEVVYAVDVSSGKLLWFTPLEPLRAIHGVRLHDGNAIVTTSEERDGGQSRILAIDLVTGHEAWSSALPVEVVSALETAGNDVVVVGSEYYPFCL